jgi:Xaa-Pro dipeptidase
MIEPDAIPSFSIQERDRRWGEVRTLMERDGFDAIVTSPNTSRYDEAGGHTRYLSQIGGNAVGASVVLPREGEPTAIVGHVPGPEHWVEAYGWVTDVRDIGLGFAYAPPIVVRLRELKLERGRIGLTGLTSEVRAQEGTFIHGMFEGLRSALPDAELTDASELVHEARYVKGAEEIDALTRAVHNAEAMLVTLEEQARPGVPENVVWGRMIATLVERGGDLPNVLLWHAGQTQRRNRFLPTNRKLQAGDMITVEVDGRYMGYNGQVTTHAFLGPVPALYQELHEVQQQVVARCYELLKPGTTLADFEALHKDAAKDTGYECRIIMHGRGLGDDPPIAIASARDKRMARWPILVGAAFSIKPRVSVPSNGASDPAHFVGWGDTVVATPTGARRLGSMPAELIAIDC